MACKRPFPIHLEKENKKEKKAFSRFQLLSKRKQWSLNENALNTQTKQTPWISHAPKQNICYMCRKSKITRIYRDNISTYILIVTEDSNKFKQSSSNSRFLCEDQLRCVTHHSLLLTGTGTVCKTHELKSVTVLEGHHLDASLVSQEPRNRFSSKATEEHSSPRQIFSFV